MKLRFQHDQYAPEFVFGPFTNVIINTGRVVVSTPDNGVKTIATYIPQMKGWCLQQICLPYLFASFEIE